MDITEKVFEGADTDILNSMRVLMIGLDLNPPWVEGIRNTVRLISQNLIKHDHKIYILTKGSNNQLYTELIEGIKYHRILIGHSDSYLSGVFTFLMKLPVQLIKTAKHERIDIIHGHSVYPLLGIIFGLISKIIGVKSIFTLYSSTDDKNMVTNYSSFINICLRISKCKLSTKLLQYFVDIIIVTSSSTYTNLVSIGINKSRIIHVNIGVNTSIFKPLTNFKEVKNKVGIPTDRKMILFAGDIAPWKGADIFIKSLKILQEKRSDILGVIMEKGICEYRKNRKQQLDNMIEQECIEKNILFIGQYKNIQELYGISDVVVLPYLSSFSLMDIPLSLLEAMAMEKPVIATRVGGIPEVIEHKKNGILIAPNNVAEVVDAVSYVLENTNESKKMGIEGSKLISERFNMAHIAKELEKIYRKTLSDGIKK